MYGTVQKYYYKSDPTLAFGIVGVFFWKIEQFDGKINDFGKIK